MSKKLFIQSFNKQGHLIEKICKVFIKKTLIILNNNNFLNYPEVLDIRFQIVFI